MCEGAACEGAARPPAEALRAPRRVHPACCQQAPCPLLSPHTRLQRGRAAAVSLLQVAVLCCAAAGRRDAASEFFLGGKKKKKESLKSKFYTAFALAPASARGSSAVVWLYGTGLHIPVPYESLGNVRYVGMVQLQFFLPLISCIMWPFEK